MATLQELKKCSVVCLPLHSGQVGSSFFPHRTRFALEGGRSYTDLTRRLMRSGVVCQMSFHLIVKDFCRALYQLCSPLSLLRLMDSLLESWFSRISLMTMSLFSFHSAFDHHFVTDQPRRLWSVRSSTSFSYSLKHSLAWSVASKTFHSLPVFMVGCTVLTIQCTTGDRNCSI